MRAEQELGRQLQLLQHDRALLGADLGILGDEVLLDDVAQLDVRARQPLDDAAALRCCGAEAAEAAEAAELTALRRRGARVSRVRSHNLYTGRLITSTI